MVTLTVRNLDEEVVNRLRLRAEAHGRSLEAEHREILESALPKGGSALARNEVADLLTKFRERTGGRGSPSGIELLHEVRADRMRTLAGPDGET